MTVTAVRPVDVPTSRCCSRALARRRHHLVVGRRGAPGPQLPGRRLGPAGPRHNRFPLPEDEPLTSPGSPPTCSSSWTAWSTGSGPRVPLRRRLGRRRGRPPAAARRAAAGLQRHPAVHRGPDRDRRELAGADRDGPGRRARPAWSARPRPAGSAPASWTASPHAARPCCMPPGRRRRWGTPRSARRARQFDVREGLGEITTAVLAVAGSRRVLPHRAGSLRSPRAWPTAGWWPDGVGHLAPAEAPEGVARPGPDQAYGARSGTT